MVRKKASAENAAARAFLADAAVQAPAANMDPAHGRQRSEKQKQIFQVVKAITRAKRAAKAAARRTRPLETGQC